MPRKRNPIDKLRTAAMDALKDPKATAEKAVEQAKGTAAIGKMVAGQVGRTAVSKAAEAVRSRQKTPRTATSAPRAASPADLHPVPSGPQAVADDAAGKKQGDPLAPSAKAAAKKAPAKTPAKKTPAKKTAAKKTAAKKAAAHESASSDVPTPADVAKVVAKKAPAKKAAAKKTAAKKAPAKKTAAKKIPAANGGDQAAPGDRLPPRKSATPPPGPGTDPEAG